MFKTDASTFSGSVLDFGHSDLFRISYLVLRICSTENWEKRWRKRAGIEPTEDASRRLPTGFEARGGHQRPIRFHLNELSIKIYLAK